MKDTFTKDIEQFPWNQREGKARTSNALRVVDVMMGTPYFCGPESNLGEATELMWKGNCGFLPVMGSDGKVIGVVTDRDICTALGTQGRPESHPFLHATVPDVTAQGARCHGTSAAPKR